MKCAYKHCKFGGNVEKDKAIKTNNRYWHLECDKENSIKKEIRDLYYDKFSSQEPMVAVNGAINKYINEQNYEANYVLYCLKYIAKNLNSIYGLSYTLSYKDNYKNYKKYIAKHTKIEFNQVDTQQNNEDKIKIQSKEYKRWGDYF